jgi:hypothetical protein
VLPVGGEQGDDLVLSAAGSTQYAALERRRRLTRRREPVEWRGSGQLVGQPSTGSLVNAVR